MYRYLLKLNSLRNVHKTSKLYKRNKEGMAEVLIIWGGMAAKRLRTPGVEGGRISRRKRM